jgi:polyisoprenoid-binding protein YceI
MSATQQSPVIAPAGTWSVDASHSNVGFAVKHLGIATVRGSFEEFQGTLELGEDLSGSTASGTVVTGSITTREEKRDAHLRSPDFFDADAHPELTFVSREIRAKDEETFEIDGDITIRGVTKPITLTAEVQGHEQDPWGNERVGLEVRGQLDRRDFGLVWNQALGSGNVLVADKVKLELDLSAVRSA